MGRGFSGRGGGMIIGERRDYLAMGKKREMTEVDRTNC